MNDDYPGTVHEPTTIIDGDELEMSTSARIDSYCLINASGGMKMGDQSCIHAGSRVVGSDECVLGERSVICYNAVVLTTSADLRYPASSMVPESERGSIDGGVTIGCEAFVGSQAVIAPGVDIADGAVVAAGAYVDEDVPKGMIRYPDGWTAERPDGPWRLTMMR